MSNPAPHDQLLDFEVRAFTRADGFRFEVSQRKKDWATWDSAPHADEAAEIEAEMQKAGSSIYVPGDARPGGTPELSAATIEALNSRSRCVCGCCHIPDNGACPTFEAQQGGDRCVYCDHAEPCHERDRERQTFNTPTGVGYRDLSPEVARAIIEHNAIDLVEARRMAVRQGIGIIKCAGGCGKPVSVNKGWCRACWEMRQT